MLLRFSILHFSTATGKTYSVLPRKQRPHTSSFHCSQPQPVYWQMKGANLKCTVLPSGYITFLQAWPPAAQPVREFLPRLNLQLASTSLPEFPGLFLRNFASPMFKEGRSSSQGGTPERGPGSAGCPPPGVQTMAADLRVDLLPLRRVPIHSSRRRCENFTSPSPWEWEAPLYQPRRH